MDILQKKIDTLLQISDITLELNGTLDLDHLLQKITEAVKQLVQTEAGTIFLIDEDAQEIYFKVALGEKGEELKRTRIPLDDHSVAGWTILNRKIALVEDTASDARHYKKIDDVVQYQTKSILAVPIIYGEECLGAIEAINKHDGGKFTEDDQKNITLLATQAAVALKNANLVEELKNFFVNGVELLINALETINPYHRGHIFRVARTATAIARAMNITGKDYENIYYAALLHDIGKIKLESGQLTFNENYHAGMGADMLGQIKIFQKIAPLVRHHHENFDGSGFPDGLKGEAIPLGARIIGLADAYDIAMGESPSLEGLLEFREKKYPQYEEHFDPGVMHALVSIVS